MVIRDPTGIVLAAMLGLLTVVALVSLAVMFMSLVALVLMPLLGATVREIRRWMWRDWHPPTDWVPGPVPAQPEPVRSAPVTLVASHAADADVRLLTTRPPSLGEEEPTLTTVHARLAPAATLELPAHVRSPMVVCVLSGHGTVGADHRHVDAGQLAVLQPGTPVTVAADRADSAGKANRTQADRPAMEVLVAQLPGAAHRAPATRAQELPAGAPGRRTRPTPLRPLGAAVAACAALVRPPRIRAPRTRRRPAA